jgi:DmsE family decaheme c-type cytochrome
MAPHGCETCHGPGSLHVEDPDNDALRPRVTRMTPEQQSETCQTCHDGREQLFWESSKHAKRDLSCASCHSIHSPQSDDGQLQLASDVEQCATCHKDVRAETWKNSHHPIREGEITCADCHNPHGSPAERMVRGDSINDLCYTCHTEKRGPFLWEHAPVRESCMTCHTPHGSNHAKLQRVAVPYLCQQCHANTRHPGTLYDARNLPVAPDGLPVPSSPSNRIVERGCVNCHSAVHGSNHPSSPYLAH